MKSLALVAAMLIALPAAAQDTGWYVGASLGQSSVDIDTGPFAADLASVGLTHGGIRTDDTDSAYKAYAGFRINRNVAIEAGLVSLGEFSMETTVTAVNGVPVIPGTVRTVVESDPGFFVSALGIVPFGGKAHFFGRLGLYNIKVTGTTTVSGAGGTAEASESDRSTGFLFGAGLGFDITRNFGVRAEWERYVDVGDENTGEGDVDVLSVGLLLRF